MSALRIDRAALSVRHLMAKDATRYAMHGMHVSSLGTVGTNGKALAWVTAAPGTVCLSRVLDAQTVRVLNKGQVGETYTLMGNDGGFETISPELPARGRRKTAVPAARLDWAGKDLDGFFPPWGDVVKPTGAYYWLKGVMTLHLEAIADVFSALGDGECCRINYTGHEIESVSARATCVGDLTLQLDPDHPPVASGESHTFDVDPRLLTRCCKVLREFLRGEEGAHREVDVRMPEPERGRKSAERGMYLEAKRADGRVLTVVIMPLALA